MHVGPAVEPLPLSAAPSSAAATLASAVEALVRLSSTSGVGVVHDMLNARLAADENIASGIADSHAPAVQHGVGEGGGIDPAELRSALSAALPGHHIVVTWAKSGARAKMDAYVMPRAELRSGLKSVTLDALNSADLKLPFEADAFTNKIQAAESAADQKGADISEAVAAELAKAWAEGGSAQRTEVIMKVIGAKLGLSADTIDPKDSFAAHGGNSFVAMTIIGQLRQILG